MSKRFQPMKEFGRTTKKPKLDITINRGRPVQPSQHLAQPHRAASAPSTSKPRAPSPVKCSPNSNHNLWDDDDDDVILLATQVAETEAAAALQSTKSAPATAMDITESEITFSEFAPHAHASSSTQKPSMDSAKTLTTHQDILSEMFGDDEDDDFVMLAAAQVAQATSPPKPVQSGVFKIPALPSALPAAASKTTAFAGSIKSQQTATGVNSDIYGSISLTQTQPSPVSASQSSIARRQLASERQIKFLMERVDALKKENTKLTKDLSDNKAKMESKEGEAALLRDELRHMKQQIQSLKMEKIFSTEAAKTECKTKIAELSKKVEATETELQLKSVEYSVLKMRHADETQRFQMSMRQDDESMIIGAPAERADKYSNYPNKDTMHSLMRMRGLTLNETTSTTVFCNSSSNAAAASLNELIYESSHERGGNTTKKQRTTLFQRELDRMQTIVAQLQLLLQHTPQLSESQAQSYTDKTLASVCLVFPEFWSYVHSLEFPKNCRIHPQHEYDWRLQDAGVRLSLHQPGELHTEERALSLRRYVAALSVVCRQLPTLVQALLSYKHGEYLLLQIASDAIGKLGFSREVCEHFGLLEAFAALLHQFLLQVAASADCTSSVKASQVELLVGLLKQLAFTRPSAWIFRELSFSLLTCNRLPSALAMLCVNSGASSFVSDRVRSLYRFSNDSCLLQVYAGLLEIAFPLSTPLQPKHFELLTVICANHVRFVYACFANPPKFIRDLLPSYDTDDEEDEDGKRDDAAGGDVDVSAFQSANSTTAVDGSYSTCTTSTASTIAAVKVAPENITCECYTKLCLSVVTLLFQVLRQWLRTEKMSETSRVSVISKVSVQLLHIIFCDNYLTRLFRDSEETTKHYLCLICKWWSENAEMLHFKEIHMNFLQKLQNSHVMPKQINDEEKLGNVTVDSEEWHCSTSDTATSDNNFKDSTTNLRKLKLIEEAGNAIKFFEGLEGYAFNFQ